MKNTLTILAILSVGLSAMAQEKPTDSLQGKNIVLDEVLVSAVRTTKESPVTFSNLTKEQFKTRNLGQDIPVLINFLPSVVTTSDAGAGIGYTGFRVRGSDNKKVNVTINGIPYNDAESHGTFWVNLQDFASSTESLQLQRGVGTSTSGSGAFGASLNILTDAVANESYGQVSTSIGSFGTIKNNIKFSTGLLNNQIEISGRLSKIVSDGYIERASSDLKSYFLQGAYVDDNTLIKALVFGGFEKTYQSWDGIDTKTLNANRTYNPVGKYTDASGNTKFYDNEVDYYNQDHYQLHWNQKYANNWFTNIAVHYTWGRGYFEQYKEGEDFADYGFTPILIGGETIDKTDLVRRKWLDNDFYGTTFSLNYKNTEWDVVFGGAYNIYKGDHYGEVIWAKFTSDSKIRAPYYSDFGHKKDFNLFAKAVYKLDDKFRFYGDLQYRSVGYKANVKDTATVDDTFNFFNPKAGVTFKLNHNNNFYFLYAVANREPNRDDYKSGNPKPEKLNDFELGWRCITSDVQLNTNVYYMSYKDQLVLTGKLNDVGGALRENIGDSYRLGIEIDVNITLGNHFFYQDEYCS